MSKGNGRSGVDVEAHAPADVTEVYVSGGGTHGAPVVSLRATLRPGESAEAAVERLAFRADAMAAAQKAARDQRALREKLKARVIEISQEIDKLRAEQDAIESRLVKLYEPATPPLPGLAGGSTPQGQAAGD